MESLSNRIHGTTGSNPFREVQAKTFGDDKLVTEFYPTTSYLSLFNEQHEILLGSRGSGKTAILRMLSYSCLKRITDSRVRKFADQHRYFGFYIPLHLEFMASLPQDSFDGTGNTEFFQFAFNCAAAKAFLTEIQTLTQDTFKNSHERLKREAVLIERISAMWLLGKASKFATFEDIADEVDRMYYQQQPWKDGTTIPIPLFAKHLFAPIMAVLPQVCRELNIDINKTHWLACVDEAEFIKPAYLRCFNSFMRSEKRPIVLKLATQPYKYTILDTLIPGIVAESNGNDFNFRSIDLAWNSEDFRSLADHILDRRLNRTGFFDEPVRLEEFVGKIGDDDPKDYFRADIGDDIASDQWILDGILKELSAERRARFENIRDNPDRVSSDYFKKFSPVFYMRYLKRETAPGNRKAGLFAGPELIRRIADGNPRRFILIMHDMFEQARASKLGPKNQHEIIELFAEREFERAAGLPEYGILLDGILKAVGTLLESRVHGKREMIEAGINFEIQPALLSNPVVRGALELGIGYSFLFVDQRSLLGRLTQDTEFRLAHVVAAKYWLPMRRGTSLVLQSRHAKELISQKLLNRAPSTSKECSTALGVLQLDLFEQPEKETRT